MENPMLALNWCQFCTENGKVKNRALNTTIEENTNQIPMTVFISMNVKYIQPFPKKVPERGFLFVALSQLKGPRLYHGESVTARSQLSSTLTNLINLDIFFNHYDENFAAGLFGDRKRKVERGLPDLKRLQRLPPWRLHIQYQAAH